MPEARPATPAFEGFARETLGCHRAPEVEGLGFTVVPDETGALASQWGVPGVPATFVLDPAGRIAHATPGLSSEWGLRARLWAARRID